MGILTVDEIIGDTYWMFKFSPTSFKEITHSVLKDIKKYYKIDDIYLHSLLFENGLSIDVYTIPDLKTGQDTTKEWFLFKNETCAESLFLKLYFAIKKSEFDNNNLNKIEAFIKKLEFDKPELFI